MVRGDRLPGKFWVVILAEMAERASFIGVSALLVNFAAQELGFSQSDASSLVSFFFAFCYITPFIGGYVADRVLGPYRTVMLFGLICLSGHILLGFASSPASLYVALFFLGLGAGAIKSSAPTMIGQVVASQSGEALLGRAFTYFYAAINIAALLANLSVPAIRDSYGYSTALAAPLFSMAIAVIVLWFCRRSMPTEIMRVAPVERSAEAGNGRPPMLLYIAPFLVIYYFALFQGYSTWTLFITQRMDLTLPVGGIAIAPEQVLAVNPFIIIALAPLVNLLWERWAGKDVSANRLAPRVFIGFLIASCGPLLLAYAAMQAEGGVQPNVAIALVATAAMALAEIFVAVNALQLAYAGSSSKNKALTTALFYGTVAAGNLIGGFAGRQFSTDDAASFFLTQSSMLGLAAIGILFVLRHLGRRAPLPAGPS
jgi:POT family proton-dependent oligopeptide transporter